MNNRTIIICVICIIIIIIVTILVTEKLVSADTSLEGMTMQPPLAPQLLQLPPPLPQLSPTPENQIANMEVANTLAIQQYDYGKLYDPLEQPARRVSRYELPPAYFRQMIDLSTHGYPDNFTQYGLLLAKHNRKEGDNKILRLFGRQEYPGSNRYEYYTSIYNGNENIKIPIHHRRNELYDGDEVYIKELERHYKVKLYKYDAPKYYPDIF